MPNDALKYLVDALEFNEGINFSTLLLCVILYFVFFWFAVCVWVYNDAKKRYKNVRVALAIAGAVFILFFPALILYLAVRVPYYEDDLDIHGYSDGGVNVPIVNFVGENGIQMSLELNIHPDHDFNRDKAKDMKVDVNWYSDKSDFKKLSDEEIKEIKLINSKKKEEGLEEVLQPITKRISNFISKIKSAREKRSEKTEEVKEDEPVVNQEPSQNN